MRISITLLQYDHGIIRQVLDVVGEVVRTHQAPKHVSELEEALIFLDRFMDRFHHVKEERFLFPAAAEECPKVIETLGRLKEEHNTARRLLHRALKAIEAGDVERMEQEARALVDHMTVNISEEENNVFPVVENGLQLETDADLHAKYQKFMVKEFGSSYYQVAEEYANALQERLLGSGHFKGIC